jgi:hypothetical protein
MAIRDTNSDVLLSANFAMRSGEVSTATIQIDCLDGYSLFGSAVADIAVEARHGTSGAWTNIETTPIDLSAYDGQLETFQVRFTAGTITARTARTVPLTVRRPT